MLIQFRNTVSIFNHYAVNNSKKCFFSMNFYNEVSLMLCVSYIIELTFCQLMNSSTTTNYVVIFQKKKKKVRGRCKKISMAIKGFPMHPKIALRERQALTIVIKVWYSKQEDDKSTSQCTFFSAPEFWWEGLELTFEINSVWLENVLTD